MGNINAVPVVSQVKSLVQVIQGDEEAARKTQEEFIRTAPVAAQINSLVHHINGDDEGALEIQKEHGRAMLDLAEGTPVVGHITAGVYAATGDFKKAENVAIEATKSTVVMAAGIAGAACGPGAAACGATFAVAANGAWDLTDSVVAGESRGVVKQVEKMANGNATSDDIFDTVAGQTMIAAGGAMGAHSYSKGSVKIGIRGKGYRKICKRSILENAPEDLLFHTDFNAVPRDLVEKLPPTLKNFEVETMTQSTPQLVDSIISIFLIIKLMTVGHPMGKRYLDEVCSSIYPNLKIQECEFQLFNAMQRFENQQRSQEQLSSQKDLMSSLLDVLVFESQSMMQNSPFSNSLMASICIHVKDSFAKCMGLLSQELQKLKDLEKSWKKSQAKLRIRRDAVCGGGGGGGRVSGSGKGSMVEGTKKVSSQIDLDNNLLGSAAFKGLTQTSPKFNLRHVLDDIDFDVPLTLGRKSTLANKRHLDLPAEHTPSINTYIKSSDAARLLDMSEVQGVRYITRNNELVKSDVYLTNGKIDYIQTDYLTGKAVRGQDFVRFSAVDGKVVHFDGLVSS